VRREALATLFFPDTDDPLGALRWQLSALRHQIGPALLVAHRDRVQLDHAACWVDADTFEHALDGSAARSIEQIVAALNLYRGEYLTGMSLPDAPEFDLWLLGRQAYYRQRYEHALTGLVERLIREERTTDAIVWAQRLVQSDALAEPANLQLMRLYALNGQRAAALAHYEQYRRLLHAEIQAEPGSEAAILYAEIAAGRVTPIPAPPPALSQVPPPHRHNLPALTPPFQGRDTELAQLRAILTEKLYLPPMRPRLVQRPRLIDLRDPSRPLTLIAAPAGSGKTTLAGAWIAQIDRPVAWLSLDEDDNDPTRFLTYFIAALQTLWPNMGETALPLLHSPQPPPPKSILTLLLNDLNTLSTPYLLVLDDYHVIDTSPIHEALAWLIDRRPRQMHLVITSRTDPPLPLARWRARGHLTELRAADLRFTPDESARFLNETMSLRLSADDIAALEARTEGWIAGLQLAALSLQGHDDVGGFIRAFSGSHAFIVDYLVDEVLRWQTETIQHFLLHTAILDRLTAPLCDAVLGNSESSMPHAAAQALLEQIERANLFLIPLDDERRWYRYHQLFAEVLRHRLQQARPDHWLELHRRAGEWYAHQGMLREAITHALAARDFKRAAQWITQTFFALWVQGELATLLNWIKASPEEELRAHPQGNIGYAWALAFAGQAEAAEARLQLAEEALRASPTAARAALDDLWGQVIALRARLAARRGDWQMAIDLAQTALARLSPASVGFRGEAYYSRALAYLLKGALPEAGRASAEASAFGWATGNYLLAVNSERNAALAHAAQGHLRAAAETYQQMLAQALAHADRLLPAVGIAHVGQAEICYQWNDLDAAARHVQTGLALGRAGGLADILFSGSMILAQLRVAQGQGEAALESLRQAERLAAHMGAPQAMHHVHALAALIQLQLGRHAAAALWAQTYRDSGVDRAAYAHEVESLVLARVWIAQGNVAEAATLLAHLLPAAEAAERMGSVIELLALQALVVHGDPAGAFAALARALTLAEPEGYVRVFVDAGEVMREVLSAWRSEMARRGSAEVSSRVLAYADKLLEAFAKGRKARDLRLADAVPAPSLKPQASRLVEPLSDREREVLRLVADGLSDRAISDHLVLAIGTVKKHLNNIYGKLGVHTRTQALARASALNLF
jgi:LuxR family transcriptional regulator, maltose regulon positive regulatory protein